MSSINQQPLANPLTLADLIAIWSSENGDTRRASLTALLALIQANITFPSLNPAGQVTFLPFVGGTNNIIAQPAADVALPAAPVFGQTIEWIVTGTNTGAVTIAVTSSGGAQPVKAVQYKGNALVGGELDAGGSAVAIYDGAAYQLVASAVVPTSAATAGSNALIGGYLDWTVAGNALTLAVKADSGNDPSPAEPVYYTVRSLTATDGKMELRSLIAALSLVVPNGALLGTASTVPFRLWATIFNDAGTDRLAVINCLTTAAGTGAGRNVTAIYGLAGFAIGTSIVVSAAANLSATFYTNNGVASKGYATIGYGTWETGLVTAGQWSAAPTRKQLFGQGVPLPGQVIQSPITETGATATGATVLPIDDTIPQITEGVEFMTQGVTFSSAANVSDVSAQAILANDTASVYGAALFQDATANALAAVTIKAATVDSGILATIFHRMLAGSTAAITYRLRAGANAGTNRINGGSARLFGGVMNSFMQVIERMG